MVQNYKSAVVVTQPIHLGIATAGELAPITAVTSSPKGGQSDPVAGLRGLRGASPALASRWVPEHVAVHLDHVRVMEQPIECGARE